jgi:two-component system, response regulator FlrC
MGSRGNILVVDDDQVVRLMLQEVLQRAGFQTCAVESGRLALKMLEALPFDLVLTDKNMPDMDGHTLINELWMRFPTVGAVMLTGYRNVESEARAREQRVLAYMEKPIFDMRIVPELMEAALSEQRRRLGGSGPGA